MDVGIEGTRADVKENGKDKFGMFPPDTGLAAPGNPGRFLQKT